MAFYDALTGLPNRRLLQVARELIAVISRGYRIGTHDLHVGGSLGIALYPDHGKTLAELLKHADIAMYTTKAVEAARNWHAAGRDLRVSVNLSARSLHDDELLSYVETLPQVNRLPPERLIIELTETVAIKHPEAAERVLRALQALGLDLAIDDFGSGYASLTYLRRFPAQRLKLHRSLTHGIGKPQDEVLLQAAIALDHGLGLEVVAEGIETEEQRAWLEQHRCDYAQGFLIGRPVAGEKV